MTTYTAIEINDEVKTRLDRADASDCYINEDGEIVLADGAEPFADTDGLRIDGLPLTVIARWDAEDWDDEKMVASKYRYQAADTFEPIELTEEQAARYAWGQCDDNITGGSQAGDLR